MSGLRIWRNAMLEKEFRLRMRSVRSPLAIMLYVLAIGAIAIGYIYMEFSRRGTFQFNPNDSRELFAVLSVVQLVLISFMTPGLTAGVISGEREKQTLNILLTTQQSSASIILSKLASSLSFMLLIVLATLPVYGIAFLYGGISPGQLVSVFAFYLFTMFMLGCFGTLFSTLFQRTVVSVIVSYGYVLAINGATFLIAMFLATTWANNTTVPGWILGLNPVGALISLLEPRFSDDVFSGKADVQLWQVYVAAYVLLSAAALWLSIHHLRPRPKR